MEGELVIFISVGIVGIVLFAIAKIFFDRQREFVKENSNLYRRIVELNDLYQFINLKKDKLTYSLRFDAKRKFDNFNGEKHLTQMILEDYDFYLKLYDSLQYNRKIYREYLEKYKAIEIYTDKEVLYNVKMGYKLFNFHEKSLYKKMKKSSPIMEIKYEFQYSYTTPSGRYHYSAVSNPSFEKCFFEAQSIKDKKKRNETLSTEDKLKYKQLIAKEEKIKQKEVELKESIKRVNNLEKKEEELKEKEAEFIEATKGHIYSSNANVVMESSENVQKEGDTWQKLKALKQAYDNGEISYEEYNEKRKELL